MKDTIRYYDRNNVLRLTLNEYPYYSEPSDLKDWIWGFNEQFGVINTFYRNKTEYELVVGIAGDYLPHHDALCDIFSADVIANEPGYLELRGWRLPCYIVEASYEYGLSLDRQAKFRVRSVNSTWIRTNTRSYNGVPGGGLGGEDLGRDYIFSYVPPEKYEDMGEIIKIENDEGDLTLTSLSVSLSPIQSLNGYDKPWVGGAGKNLFWVQEGSDWSGISCTLNSKGAYVLNGTTASGTPAFIRSTAVTLKAGTYRLWGKADNNPQNRLLVRIRNATTMALMTTVTPDNGTGANVSIAEDTSVLFEITVYDSSTLTNTVVYPQLEVGTTKTEWEPYSNICPISGRTEVVTHRTGKNLLNLDRTLGTPNPSAGSNATSPRVMDTEHYYVGLRHDNYYYPSNVAEYSVTSNEVVVRGTNNAYGVGFPIEVKPNTQYKVSATVEGSGYLGISYYDAQWHYISFVNDTSAFTTPSNASYAVILLRSLSTSATATWRDVKVELGSTATDYEPYQGNTYTTALGRTVYGGTLDVVSGVLTVDRAMVDLGTLSWIYDSAVPRFYSSGIASVAKGAPASNKKANIICSAYKTLALDGSEESIYGSEGNGGIALSKLVNLSVKDTSYTNATAFKTAVTGQQLVYELATPQTYQLTPQQISLLLGENNLWTNTGGTIDVKYETISAPFPARGYNYGYSQPEAHASVINLPGTGNGYEIIVYGPQTNPVIYLNNQPVQVNVELSAQQRLRIVSNGSVKTIEILSSSGQATDAFVYRDKENTPFLTLGQHTDLTFGQIRFDFTTIERRSEPTWT